MDSLLQILPYIPSGAIPIVVCVCFYFVIQNKRKETAQKRDADTESINTRLALIENEIEQIKQLDLAGRLASIETSLDYIKMLLEKSNK